MRPPRGFYCVTIFASRTASDQDLVSGDLRQQDQQVDYVLAHWGMFSTSTREGGDGFRILKASKLLMPQMSIIPRGKTPRRNIQNSRPDQIYHCPDPYSTERSIQFKWSSCPHIAWEKPEHPQKAPVIQDESYRATHFQPKLLRMGFLILI